MIRPVESWPQRAHTRGVLDRYGGNPKLDLSGGQSETRVGALDAWLPSGADGTLNV
jgi:hypothetical protein